MRRPLDRRVGLPPVLLRHRRIEVGTERQRLTPMRHRKTGIQPRGFAKRANRLGMIEPIQQPQPLIEEALRLRHRCRDRHVQRPQPGELRRESAASCAAPTSFQPTPITTTATG